MTARAPGKAQPATHSLRGRLLWFVLLPILLVTVLQASTAYRGALQQADAMFDDHLQQVARSMRSAAPLGVPLGEEDEDATFNLHVQIWGQDGTPLFRSSRSALPQRAVLGFSDVEANGSRYRVYSLQTALQTVQIAQDLSARADRAQALALKAVLPFAFLTPLLMLAVWWAITRSLAPIERTRRQVAKRAADDLSALPDHDLPDEVRPLVTELNLLFGRVQNAFDIQKNFVADAAHELRSPLTALKLQAQALQRAGSQGGAEGNGATPDLAVARLNQGIDRAIRLVEQLLVLAREEASAGTAQFETIDLIELVRLAVADMLPQALRKDIDMGVIHAEAASVSGQPEALRMVMRNLLDNAVKYTPDGGQIDISIELDNGQALLAIDDSGPGVSPAARPRVFDRFYRASDALAETGSGLGLAIVKTIVDRHGATLRIDQSARLGGLRAELRMALAESADPAAPTTLPKTS
jgi:two-component system OmpR family sensor kinase